MSYEDRTLLALNISSAVHKSDKAQKTTSGVSLVVWPGPLLSVRQYGTLFLNLSNALNKNHKTQPVRYSVIRWLLHPNLSDQLEARHCIQCSRTQTHNRMVDKCHYEKLRAPLLGFKSKPLHKICYKYKIYIIFGACDNIYNFWCLAPQFIKKKILAPGADANSFMDLTLCTCFTCSAYQVLSIGSPSNP